MLVSLNESPIDFIITKVWVLHFDRVRFLIHQAVVVDVVHVGVELIHYR